METGRSLEREAFAGIVAVEVVEIGAGCLDERERGGGVGIGFDADGDGVGGDEVELHRLNHRWEVGDFGIGLRVVGGVVDFPGAEFVFHGADEAVVGADGIAVVVEDVDEGCGFCR